MSIITIDFETYYDKDYSLSKMTTEEYVNDPRFEVIGMGVKVDDQKSVWYSGKDVAYVLKNLDWSDHAVLCHNTLFDGAILAWRYGIKPGMWLDTLSMARAIHGVDAGGSLKALASRYKLGAKGDEVINALGKRLVDFDAVSLERYGDYCRNDVDLTYGLFQRLAEGFPDSELKLVDLTIRMFTEPTLKVDDALLVERLEQVKAEKQELLGSLITQTGSVDEEDVRAKLSSNPKFADILRSFGVEPPTKTSAATGKETYALAKTDQGFIDLQGHDDPIVQQLCAVRLGTKSTIEESRVGRFIGIGARNRGSLPVPLRYYGAHTGRWSGLDSVNFQNLPSRDKHKKALKNAILAPDGHFIINCDSSQIEARVLAWLADQRDLVEQFRKNEDVYSTFASKVYKYPVSESNPTERFVGKTCILGLGYGTGAAKLQHTLKLGGADLTLEMCQDIVRLYREDNHRIPKLWREYETALKGMLGGDGELPLPNGLSIRYPNLRVENEKMLYDSRKGPVNIWGGGVTENIVQALARIIVGQQMIWIAEHYRPVLTVHDAVVLVVPEDDLDNALEYTKLCMSTPPEWAHGLPVACKAKYGRTYGDC
jgi:DNA polymerase I-like protein with 3'-5' exonuclease and polymerase domains